MQTNLALANILSHPGKTVLSLAGIGIAVLLVFMQLGFRGAVANTATNIYSRLDFDLLVRSSNYLHFVDSGLISRQVCYEIQGIEGVESVKPLSVSVASWRNDLGEFKGILLLGVKLEADPFSDQGIVDQLGNLVGTDSLIIDDRTHREFSPLDGQRFTQADIGREVRVADQPMVIRGIFSMGAGLASNGAGIVSDETFRQLLPHVGSDNVTFGLIKLTSLDQADDVLARLQQRFRVGSDDRDQFSVQILDRQTVMKLELERWLGETPIGFIFTLGVVLACLVGGAIVYMVLGNDVAARLHEYATLRAMGYSNFYLAMVVMRQAIYLAIACFVPAIILAYGLYGLTSFLAGIDMQMDVSRIGLVMVLTLLMCCISGGLALRKLWQVSPADLF